MKKGFTLAEVLITLAIIGVVAALTIPSVVVNYQKTQTVTQLKKAFTTMAQAINNSQIKNGFVSTWDFTLDTDTFFERYLKDYLQISKYHKATESETPLDIEYKSLNGGILTLVLFTQNTVKFTLSDGALVYFLNYPSSNASIIGIDINGTKGPNRAGKDMFVYRIKPEVGGIQGYIIGDGSRDTLISTIGGCRKPESITSNVGINCAALIMLDGWEMKDDYPW